MSCTFFVSFSVFLSAVDFLLRMDFVMLVLVLFLAVLKKKKRDRAGLGCWGYCDCPLVMIINKKKTMKNNVLS